MIYTRLEIAKEKRYELRYTQFRPLFSKCVAGTLSFATVTAGGARSLIQRPPAPPPGER
jgi:hypothetical protein